MPDFSVDYIGKDAVNLSNPIQNEPTERDIEDMQRVLVAVAKRPTLVPEGFWAQLIDQIQVSNLQIPVGQIFGFSQTPPQANKVETLQATTSTSYTDLTTVGPELTGLPDGQYLVMYGAWADLSATGPTMYLSPSYNSATPSDDDAAINSSDLTQSIQMTMTKTLTNGGNNSIRVQYRTTGGTATYIHRWLVAWRVANP